MINLIPAVATLTKKLSLERSSRGNKYLRFSVAIEDEYYWVIAFKQTAIYLDTYANVGAKIFIKEWGLKSNQKSGNDIIVNKIEIIKNRESDN